MVYGGLAIYVSWNAPRHQRNLAFICYVLCFGIWSASLLLAHNPTLSETQGRMAYDIGVFAWGSFASLAVWFSLAFADRRELLASPWVRGALIVPPLIVIGAYSQGLLFGEFVLHSWGWSYRWIATVWTAFYYLYYSSYVGLALLIGVLSARKSMHALQRRQAYLMASTALIPLTLATFTDVVAPWLGLDEVPNIAPVFLLAWVFASGLAIVRHGLLDITPEAVAGEIIKAITDGLLLLDVEGNVRNANPAAHRIFGQDDLVGRSVYSLLGHDEMGARISGEFTVSDIGGDVFVSATNSQVTGARGEPLGTICLLRDVSAFKKSERLLRRAHEQLEERVVERTRELDAALHELRCSARGSDALNASINAIHKGDSQHEIAAQVAREIQRGAPSQTILGCRVILDGERFDSATFAESPTCLRREIVVSGQPRGWVEAYLEEGPDTHAKQEDERLVQSVAAELSYAMGALATQQSLTQAERLAVVGLLAAGVAHEINNPLAYVSQNLTELCDLIETPDVRSRAEEALEGCTRIKRIVGELGTFSRVRDEHEVFPVHRPIEASVAMAENEIRHRARLVCDLRATGLVRGNSGKLAQVFLNLLTNAAHSIPEGDTEANEVRIRTWDAAQHLHGKTVQTVCIAVEDTGAGISEALLRRLFDPFFSTKSTGVGLGLAICRNIVHSVGGSIEVQSELGKGTQVYVRLPFAENAQASTQASTPAPSMDGRRSEEPAARARILIIDDEPLVARALRRILREHECVLTESGKEAITLLTRDRAFDVIFCDVMMPDISGHEVHAWIEEHHPELQPRLFFTTGGAFGDRGTAFLERIPERVLAKPFDTQKLREVVHLALQEAK